MGEEQYDPHAWALLKQPAPDRQGAIYLEDVDCCCCIALQRHRCTVRAETVDQGHQLPHLGHAILSAYAAAGHVVIIDNLRSYKRQPIRAAIRAAGTLLLFLPAYSPDLNVIEPVLAKFKPPLHKADARCIKEVDGVLGTLLKSSNSTNVPITSAQQNIDQLQVSVL